jgi:hypothetical protein
MIIHLKVTRSLKVIEGMGNVVLKESKVISFPVFKTLGSGYQEGEFFAVVQNIGADGKFKEYVKENSNINFTGPILPEQVKNGESVLVKGTYGQSEPFLTGKIKMQSIGNQEAIYDCHINGTYLSFVQNKN